MQNYYSIMREFIFKSEFNKSALRPKFFILVTWRK